MQEQFSTNSPPPPQLWLSSPAMVCTGKVRCEETLIHQNVHTHVHTYSMYTSPPQPLPPGSLERPCVPELNFYFARLVQVLLRIESVIGLVPATER